MIVVTGAAGFIGSVLVQTLLRESKSSILAVDDFAENQKNTDLLLNNDRVQLVQRDELFAHLSQIQGSVELFYHIGARTDTTEFDRSIFDNLNVAYSKQVWDYCTEHHTVLVYASSAATYGGGEHGYVDSHEVVESLQPLNPYGDSKNEFDIWALKQESTPPKWYGVKFFNVYGPNENHKGRMASVVYHAFNQITSTGKMKLFRSHRPDFNDGEQLRDFIYVKDVVSILTFLAQHQPPSGLYNAGTGKARSFNALALAVFKSLGLKEQIEYIDTPEDIRDKYQYFTESDPAKLRSAGYDGAFRSLEDGIKEYVEMYLQRDQRY